MPATSKPIQRLRTRFASKKQVIRAGRPTDRPWLTAYGEAEAKEVIRADYTHAQAVKIVAQLSTQYRRSWSKMPDIIVDHRAIIDTLTKKKIPFVLTGMYGIASWLGRPRATRDVDILTKGGRNYGRAVKAIRELYPNLKVDLTGGITSFVPPSETHAVIDVVYPLRFDTQVTLETAIWTEDEGRRYRIPALEAALANKYGASITLDREVGKRAQDMIDFYNMVLLSTEYGRTPIDLQWLGDIAETVWPSGGRAEILRLVEDAKSGKIPNPNL
jgi:hypothetical protein